MKRRSVILLIAAIILIDQGLKIWIKTSYPVGEVNRVFGMNWFRIHFIENPGMAWGWKFGNETGKIILTLFRLVAVVFGTWYLGRIVKQGFSKGFIVCASLIYAGALGNLIDSMFYGMIFDKGLHFDPAIAPGGDYISYSGLASFSGNGYSSFLHGSVVDMLYFPIIDTKDFVFFSPIFNIADASISIGVIALLLFQKRFFKKQEEENPVTVVETESGVSDKEEVY